MHELNYYTKKAIEKRYNRGARTGLPTFSKYELIESNGVKKLEFNFTIFPIALLSGFVLGPILGSVSALLITKQVGTHYFDSASGEEISESEYDSRKEKNRQADQYAREGDKCLRQRDFRGAFEKFRQAYITSQSGYVNDREFQHKRDDARVKLIENLESQGDALQNEARYSDAISAISIYSEAHGYCTDKMISRKAILLNKKENCEKNQHAMSKYRDGEAFLQQKRYNNAIEKFIEALRVCATDFGRRNEISAKLQRAQAETKLTELEKLWDEALRIENDAPIRAKEMLENILTRARSLIAQLPLFQQFALMRDKVTLKIEGNNLFNEGIKLQKEALELLIEARTLLNEHKFDSADQMLGKAKEKLKIALIKFQEGRRTDERFKTSVDFVEMYINSFSSVEQLRTDIWNEIQDAMISIERFSGRENADEFSYLIDGS